MFFMITPPEATVERAWNRGRRSAATRRSTTCSRTMSRPTPACRGWSSPGRHKDKTVHYEFLDNDVPEGERPRTAAFGANGEMNVLDIER